MEHDKENHIIQVEKMIRREMTQPVLPNINNSTGNKEREQEDKNRRSLW